ncbi:glycosyltransferase [Mesorhizobium sp. M0809]
MLLITKSLAQRPSGGRELLCKVNHDCLEAIYGDRLTVFELPASRTKTVRSLVGALMGYIDGIDEDIVSGVCKLIRQDDITKVFVDGSNLGRLTAEVKRKLPDVYVYTFFHNVEARFFWGALKQRKSPWALAVLIANYVAERMSVRTSDNLISLSSRDSKLLKRVYGRSATTVSAIALWDKLPRNGKAAPRGSPRKYILFVGGAFYANRSGIAWFIRNVVPHIQMKTYVVGRGFEAFRREFERTGKVEVIGGVDSLADWYRDAHLIIAPVFDGSGMKTKVAEALMFGKKIAGTPEAFSGYEDIVYVAGWKCRTAEDFINVINQTQFTPSPLFDQRLRDIYEKEYSYEAALLRMSKIVGDDKISVDADGLYDARRVE